MLDRLHFQKTAQSAITLAALPVRVPAPNADNGARAPRLGILDMYHIAGWDANRPQTRTRPSQCMWSLGGRVRDVSKTCPGCVMDMSTDMSRSAARCPPQPRADSFCFVFSWANPPARRSVAGAGELGDDA
jgi:hypothetical protein